MTGKQALTIRAEFEDTEDLASDGPQLPKTIRALRGGRSRAVFARELGVTAQTVYRWELPDDAAEARRPRGPLLERILQMHRAKLAHAPCAVAPAVQGCQAVLQGDARDVQGATMSAELQDEWERAEQILLSRGGGGGGGADGPVESGRGARLGRGVRDLVAPLQRISTRGASREHILRELLAALRTLLPGRAYHIEERAPETFDESPRPRASARIGFGDGDGHHLQLTVAEPLDDDERAILALLAMTTTSALEIAQLHDIADVARDEALSDASA